MPSGSWIHSSVRPQGSAGLPDDRDSGRGKPGVRGADIHTWIQIIAESPGGPSACPETSSNPRPGKNTTSGSLGDRTPLDGQAQHVVVEAAPKSRSPGRRRIRLLRTARPFQHHVQ